MASQPSRLPSLTALPPELRHKIWLATFEPRTLSLSRREHKVPRDGWSITQWLQTFDVQLGLHVDQLSDEEARANHALNPPFIWEYKDVFGEAARIKVPPGPVALEVCQESRNIALKHYELMFPASVRTEVASPALTAAFKESGWGLPHTWVNLELDLIFLSCMSRDLYSGYAPGDVQMLFYNDKEEARKIQRLGVMSHGSDIHLLLMIRKYSRLRELTVYLTDRDQGLQHLKLDEPGYPDLQHVGEVIEECLVAERDKHNARCGVPDRPSWKPQVPKIRVSREIEWYRDESDRRKLRLVPQES